MAFLRFRPKYHVMRNCGKAAKGEPDEPVQRERDMNYRNTAKIVLPLALSAGLSMAVAACGAGSAAPPSVSPSSASPSSASPSSASTPPPAAATSAPAATAPTLAATTPAAAASPAATGAGSAASSPVASGPSATAQAAAADCLVPDVIGAGSTGQMAASTAVLKVAYACPPAGYHVVEVETVSGPAGTAPGELWKESPSAGSSAPSGATVTLYFQP